jgi:DNA polymerase-3 subunit delta
MSATEAPLAYYWGDDLHALDSAAAAFAGRLAGPDAPVETWRVRGDAVDADAIAERVGTAPLFGGGTLVVVAEPAPLLRSKEGRAAISALLPMVAPGNGLVFLESVDGSGRRPAALDHLRSEVATAGGETREFKAPKEGQLAAWIEARARERGLRFGPGAAKGLAERIGGFVREGDVDRRRQSQLALAELEKLALYRPNGEVSIADVEALVPEAIPGSTWAFLDAIAERRARVASGLLERLIETTPEPVLVVQLHRRLRELLEVADRLERGETPGSLVRSMKLKPYRADRLAAAARAWRAEELVGALEGLLELDIAAKGADRVPATEAQRRLRFALWIAERVAPARR